MSNSCITGKVQPPKSTLKIVFFFYLQIRWDIFGRARIRSRHIFEPKCNVRYPMQINFRRGEHEQRAQLVHDQRALLEHEQRAVRARTARTVGVRTARTVGAQTTHTIGARTAHTVGAQTARTVGA